MLNEQIICADGQTRGFERYPKFRALYVRAFDRMIERRKTNGLPTTWKNGEEVMRWWLNDNPKEG